MSLAFDSKKREEDELKEELKRKYIPEILKRLGEFEEYINKRDPVQASEKIYKAAEEFIKLMAELRSLPEAKEAKTQGKWSRRLIDKASYDLELAYLFDMADKLHIWAFHERAMDVEDVAKRGRQISYDIRKVLKEEGLIDN